LPHFYHQPSVLCIQEPWCIDSSIIPSFHNYNMEYIQHVSGKTGILLYIHTSVLYSCLSHTYPTFAPSTYTMCTWFQLSSPLLTTPIILGTCYISNKLAPYPSADFMNFITLTHHVSASHPNYPCIIVGDFNSRHKYWDSTSNSLGPSIYHNFILNDNYHFMCPFTLINKHFNNNSTLPTRPASNSVIDLAFTSAPASISAFHVLSDCYLLSDHYPIQIDLSLPSHSLPPSCTNQASSYPLGY
jgi:hypothetical protein